MPIDWSGLEKANPELATKLQRGEKLQDLLSALIIALTVVAALMIITR